MSVDWQKLQDDWERRIVADRPFRDWPKIAELMGWTPDNSLPSWMGPEGRRVFWREVKRANDWTALERSWADFGRELAEGVIRWTARMGALVRRLRP